MKRIIVVFTFLAIVSCKDKKQKLETDSVAELPAGNEFFRVTLDVVAEKDDSFHVYYIEDPSQNFTEENSVWAEFKGSPNRQKLNFDFPPNVIPMQLRVDFGLTKDQGAVRVNDIEMSYFDKATTIAGNALTTYFRPNEENTIIDTQSQQIKSKDSNFNPYYAPSIYSLEALTNKIQSIIK